jgi:hypothetical protein
VAGRRNRPATIWLPANDHAVLTHLQQTGWDLELLRNRGANPLLRAAASIRGSREVAEVIADRISGPTEADLMVLATYLVDILGPDWPAKFDDWLARRPDAP